MLFLSPLLGLIASVTTGFMLVVVMEERTVEGVDATGKGTPGGATWVGGSRRI